MFLVGSNCSTQDGSRLVNDSMSARTSTNDLSKLPEIKRPNFHNGLKSENNKIGMIFVIISILTQVTSSVLLSLIWNYLNNMSVTKRCLLLYLYQDAVAITLMASYIWSGIIVFCYSDPQGHMSNLVQATVLSVCLISVELALILILNFVSIIKIYTMKEKVIDPPMPWYDDDEKVMKKIRIMIVLSIAFFVTAMYTEGLYPKAYYYIIGDHTPLMDLSNGPKIFEGVLGILSIVPTVTMILACFYRQTEEQALATKREGKVYLLVVTFIVIMVSGMVYGAFSDRLGHFLTVGQFLVTVAMVGMPCFIILKSNPLKSSCRKVILNFYSLVADKFTTYCGRFNACMKLHQSPNQIVPIV